VQTRRGEAQAHLLVRTNGRADPVRPGWEAHPVSLEELVLAYLRAPDAGQPPALALAPHTEPTEATR
jgi:ABC-2 type transport system ATP-binding protein